MAAIRMKTDTPQKMAEHLLCKYMDYYEKAVQAGRTKPLSSLDRLTLEMALIWVAEKYELVPRWIEIKQRAQDNKVAKIG